MREYREAIYDIHVEIVERYISMLSNGEVKEECLRFIEMGKEMEVDEQGRVIGYIQRMMVEKGLTTMDKERFILQPMFARVYELFGGEK